MTLDLCFLKSDSCDVRTINDCSEKQRQLILCCSYMESIVLLKLQGLFWLKLIVNSKLSGIVE